MLGDRDGDDRADDEDVLAFGSMRPRRPISRRVKLAITAGGVVAVAATTCAVVALDGSNPAASTGTVTTTTIQQDAAAQYQGPWSLDLSPGTVTHIPRPGSGESVVTGLPTTVSAPCRPSHHGRVP